jgi:hypothetical protein
MAQWLKDYLVVTIRLGTTYPPSVKLKKFGSVDSLRDWGLREERTGKKVVNIFKITHTATGVKLTGVF